MIHSAYSKDAPVPQHIGGSTRLTCSAYNISKILCMVSVILVWVIAPGRAAAVQILYIRDAHHSGPEEAKIDQLATAYGIGVETLNASTEHDWVDLSRKLRRVDTKAVVIAGDILSELNTNGAWLKVEQLGLPVLVFGIKPGEVGPALRALSQNTISRCTPADNVAPQELSFAQFDRATGPLAGRRLPAVSGPVCTMEFERAPGVEPLVTSIRSNHSDVVLLRIKRHSSETFLMPELRLHDTSWRGQPGERVKAFSSSAAILLFLRYVVGDFAWHLDGHYANLTIDDAWLTEPFGNLRYHQLLSEMERHNFHTTLAFIPWNFDRSDHELVSMFRSHPDRYSICLHGNDHKHREFGPYSRNSLQQQTADVKQGLARMERFHALTGLPYDRFMVFPQGVAPEQTFEVLRKYDFLGTANSQNVPLGNPFPRDPEFILRTYTDRYAAFPSLFRYTATIDTSEMEVAINVFLGNPLLFYGHEDLFRRGIGAFNRTADLVNRIQPDTQWRSLGDIARHLNPVRRRVDGGFDVKMLASEMALRNPANEEATFYIERREPSPTMLRALTVDGHDASFNVSGDRLTFQVRIPAQKSRLIQIVYDNDLNLAREDIRKRSLYVALLRQVSDLRDIYLSRSLLGRFITDVYYTKGGYTIEDRLERQWPWLVLCVALLWFIGRLVRRRRTGIRSNAAGV